MVSDQTFQVSDIDIGVDTDETYQLVITDIVLINPVFFRRSDEDLLKGFWRIRSADLYKIKLSNFQHIDRNFQFKSYLFVTQ